MLALLEDVDVEVGSEERAPEAEGISQPELRRDVSGDLRCRRGGEGEHGHAEPALQPLEIAVGGAEVVTPLRDAVGLVDGDEAQVHSAQRRSDRSLETFGCRVDEFVLPGPHRGDPL